MDINRFWSIIDKVHDLAGDDLDRRVETLKGALQKLNGDELTAFQRHYDALIDRSNRWDLWGAAYVINGGCSDDGFRYFRDWLISEGRATFEAALAAPDSLAKLPRVESAENESFGYVALEVFEAKGGGRMKREPSAEAAGPAGKEWSEDDLPRLFPLLHAKYGG